MNPRVVLVPLLAAGAAIAFWLASPRAPGQGGVPAATWRVGSGTEIRQARNYDELAPESPLRLSFTCDEPRHVYVFSHSITDGTLLLFPSPDVKSDARNPLPAGQTVLPGTRDEKELAWTTREGVLATTTYVLVASREPVPELEALLPRLRRWTNTAMSSGSMQVTNPPTGTERLGEPKQDLPSALLVRAAERSLTDEIVNGPLHADPQLAGVWTASVRVKETPQPPAAAPLKK